MLINDYIDPKLLTPGTVIAIRYLMYKHFAIVSDRKTNNMPNLISLSYRSKGVLEESWQTVVGDRAVEQSSIMGNYSNENVLSNARRCINKNIKYKLLTFNCEHFVRYIHGLPIESVQVKQTLYGAILGATSCALLPNLTIARFAIMTTAGAATSLRKSLGRI
jgi:hypothetical protein